MRAPKSMAVAIGFGLSFSSVCAETLPVGGLYRIVSGTYTECCGIGANDFVYPLPDENQSFVKLTIDPQSGTANMVFLGADRQTVFTTIPCPVHSAIDFSFPFGFLVAKSLVFHVDPGPPPGKSWNYTASNSVSGLRVDGLVGLSQPECLDTPTRFSHSLVAVLLPPPKLNITEFSTSRGARLFIQGNAGETNVVEASADLANWTAISTNVMDSSMCPICPYAIVEDTESTNLTHRFYRVYKM